MKSLGIYLARFSAGGLLLALVVCSTGCNAPKQAPDELEATEEAAPSAEEAPDPSGDESAKAPVEEAEAAPPEEAPKKNEEEASAVGEKAKEATSGAIAKAETKAEESAPKKEPETPPKKESAPISPAFKSVGVSGNLGKKLGSTGFSRPRGKLKKPDAPGFGEKKKKPRKGGGTGRIGFGTKK